MDKRKLPSSLGKPQGEALVRASVMSLVRASIRAEVKTIVRALVRGIIRVLGKESGH